MFLTILKDDLHVEFQNIASIRLTCMLGIIHIAKLEKYMKHIKLPFGCDKIAIGQIGFKSSGVINLVPKSKLH